jgi:hypothetical protein
MDIGHPWGLLDYLQATIFFTFLFLWYLLLMWVLRLVIGAIFTLVFEQERIHAILGYVTHKKTPFLLRPLAFFTWLVLILLSYFVSAVAGFFMLTALGNLKDRIFGK